LQAHLDALPADAMIILKLTIPTEPALYADLAADPRVLRVLALSGGYSREEARARLAQDSAMTASFSRALLEGLSDAQSDAEFNAQPAASVAQIFDASRATVT
jgi:fructose-bisphosphate aldolase class I